MQQVQVEGGEVAEGDGAAGDEEVVPGHQDGGGQQEVSPGLHPPPPAGRPHYHARGLGGSLGLPLVGKY